MMLKKRGGADLLMELALSTIIFFVIVFFLFGINIPKQQLKACASVVSADAALACETSLTNLMKAASSDGTKYSDFLMNSWISDDTKTWQKNVASVFNKVFGSGDWEVEVLLPNGTNVTPTLGGISTQQLGCNYTVPFPAALLKKDCGYAETQVPKIVTSPTDVSFDTPDGNVTFTITDDETSLGVDCTATANCKLDLEPKSIFGERIPSTIPNDPSIADSITLPVLIQGAPYVIDVEELTDANGNVKSGFNATLTHSALLKDCGLTVTLKTTNATDMVKTCGGKPVSG
ncbi:MAG: hypothetical protein NTY99_00415 [DPANN group archaeon]|nr:hypothetical protein [DPANN group archaeon]